MVSNHSYRIKANKYIPAGSHTYSRADDCYPINVPSVLEKGLGAFVWDIEGNKYLDYGMALRSVTIGYNFERISQAAISQIKNGNNLTRASKIEVDAAEKICTMIPWVEMVKFAKNGSTVTTAAIKLARAYTGKKYIVRCAQHPFFSYDDWFIGSTVVDAGIPEENKKLTLQFNYNDIDSIHSILNQYENDVAAIILEPATTIEPKEGFLNKVRQLCDENNIVLILDEMITGFRWHIQGASMYYGVIPDLVTYGKGMANGFSVAALGGKKEIMELGGIHHNKERVFLISTTHGGEMSSLGAFLETMKVYEELNVIEAIWSAGRKLTQGMVNIAKKHGLEDYFCVEGVPCSPNYLTKDDKGELSLEYRTLYVQEMVKNGVLMPWIALSLSHDDEVIERTLNALDNSLYVYKKALEDGIDKYLLGRSIKPVFRKKN